MKSRDVNQQPIWIDEGEVLAIHDRLLVLHGGGSGLRDRGLLQSALARPRQHHEYAPPGIPEMAALYTAGVIRNHPFIDGNKRVGFVVGILFLELNGYRFTASESDAAHAVLGLAAGTIGESEYTAWLTANSRKRLRR